MKRILFILSLLWSFAYAQTPTNYTNINSRYQWLAGRFKSLALPTGDTVFASGEWPIAGAVKYDSTKPAGSRFYIWNGSYWESAGGGGLSDNIYTADGTIDSIRTITIPYGSRISWLANGTSYGLDSQKPPFWYFNAYDTISNNTYSSGGGASVWNRSTLFTGNRRQYYKGYEYVTNLWANDSVRLESVGGDFGFNLRSTRVLSRSTGNTNRSVIAGAPNNDWDAAPNLIAWDVHSRPSGHSAPHRSRGWWAGISSYPLMNAFSDTLDNWIGYISMNRITSSNKIFKYIDYWAGGSIYADSTWGFYARYNTQRHYLAGPVGFGTNNSGATANVDIVGTMRLQDGNQGVGKVLTSDANGWATWQTPSGGSSQGIDDVLATDNGLTTNRTINLNGNNFFILGGGFFRVYNIDSTKRLLEVDGTNQSGFIGRGSAQRFSFSDSIGLQSIGQVIDTTIWKPVIRNSNTGMLAYSPWMYAGGGGSTSPAGSNGQVQFNNSGSFGASSNLTWDNTNARFGIGAPAFTSGENLGVKGITGSLTWIRFYSPDGGDYIRFGADNSGGHIFDWNGNMSFRINNTQHAVWSSSSYQFNTGLANIDFRISGDNETNLFYSDASADAIGIGTASPAHKLDVNGMINTPGTEANTYRWNTAASETPATTSFATPTNYYGSSITNVLGTPHAWLRVNVAGTFYIIPAYTPFVP